jgi:predicted RNase H-like HicB family nuclease
MSDNQFLEIIIQKEDNYFIAKCPSLPYCIAKRKTKKTALNALKKLIHKALSAQLQVQLSHLIDNNCFEEVVLKPSSAPSETHYIYSLANQKSKLSILLQLTSLNEASSYKTTDSASPIHPSGQTFAKSDNSLENSGLSIESFETSIILKYPLCLN